MRERIKKAAEEGILFLVKYGLILLIIIIGLNYFSRINQAALNGEQAALAIIEFQKKGWLPQIGPNGVPQKEEKVNEKNSQ